MTADLVARLEALAGALGHVSDEYTAKTIREAASALRSSGEAVGTCEVRLFDSQWVNIVNYDNCWENHSKEDAIHEAVRRTERAIAENVALGKLPQKHPTPPTSTKGG